MLTDAERARVAEIQNMKLSVVGSTGGGLSYFSVVGAVNALNEAIRDLLSLIDRLSDQPDCDGCIHDGDQFNNFCPDCDRRMEYKPDRYERKTDGQRAGEG